MDLVTAVRTRRSTAPVTDNAPTDAELIEFVQLAAHSPDHGGLRPWRLITVRGADRERLGAALAAGFGDQAGSPAAARTAGKTMRAPLLITVVGRLVEHPKVPLWEQTAAIGALVATLELVLFDAGYTAMWRTGPAIGLTEVRDVLRLEPSEQLLGWLYVGGTLTAGQQPEVEPDVAGKVTALS